MGKKVNLDEHQPGEYYHLNVEELEIMGERVYALTKRDAVSKELIRIEKSGGKKAMINA